MSDPQAMSAPDVRLCPREPTAEMIECFWATNARADTFFADPADLWRAMFDAAPATPPLPGDVLCRHEPYQGACAHCGVQFRGGSPIMLASERDEMAKVLKDYGGHQPGCRMRVAIGQSCICGWSALLAKLRPTEGEKSPIIANIADDIASGRTESQRED